MQPPDKSPALGRPTGTIVAWLARATWLVVAVLGGSAIGDALADHSRGVQLTGTIGAWAGWGTVAVALVVPSTVSLTIVRTIVPASAVAAVVAAIGGAGATNSAVCIGSTVVTAALIGSAEVGQVFAQGSAYGHERRFVLRPPVAYLLPVVVTWCLLCAAAISGPLLLAARTWWAGVPVTVVALGGGWFLGRRFHVLSRRWLVLVPAGLVVHDPLVLAETFMMQKDSLESIGLALADTQAADLTGPAAGHAVEVALRAMTTVVLAPTRAKPNGTALHVRSFLVTPTRPGRFLTAAAASGFPVG
ncbi:MAG: hypothetical protein AB7R77_21125 [Ilumatobacteraceae bacterium]